MFHVESVEDKLEFKRINRFKVIWDWAASGLRAYSIFPIISILYWGALEMECLLT